VGRVLRRARANPDWDAFDNYWTGAVSTFYRARPVAKGGAADHTLANRAGPECAAGDRCRYGAAQRLRG